MPRKAIWTSIRDTLETDLARKRYRPGDKLPTEDALAARFGVNRHTVRRAVAALADAGLLTTRRGAGIYAAFTPTDYALGRRVRFHHNLTRNGRAADKIVLGLSERAADRKEAAALGIDAGDPVLVHEGVLRGDGQPIAMFRNVFPSARLPGMRDALQGTSSVTEALRACGVPDYIRVSTRLTAKIATQIQARHLHLHDGAPVLCTVSINADAEGRPVEYGHSWFAGDRVTVTLDGAPDVGN